MYPVFIQTSGISVTPYVDDSATVPGLSYIPSTGTLSSNVFQGTAANALYADLAERYLADAIYSPGTVVDFGGAEEVTITTQSHSTRVAGVVSTNPAYLMNSGLEGNTVISVGLTGRVPCQVVGKIEKGDRLVSSNNPGVATTLALSQYQPGVILGKALESYDSTEVGIITIVVGKN
jgi:hypothetical protein